VIAVAHHVTPTTNTAGWLILAFLGVLALWGLVKLVRR
jgi:hypothetical protein